MHVLNWTQRKIKTYVLYMVKLTCMKHTIWYLCMYHWDLCRWILENGLSTVTANGNIFWGECIILSSHFYFFIQSQHLLSPLRTTPFIVGRVINFGFLYYYHFFFFFTSSVRLFPFRISWQKITRQQQRACEQSQVEPGRSIPIVSHESGHRGWKYLPFLVYFFVTQIWVIYYYNKSCCFR